MNQIQFVFLPRPQVDSYRPYDPAQGGELYALLKDSGGSQLARYDMLRQDPQGTVLAAGRLRIHRCFRHQADR